jgi:bacteriocin-like protein
LTDKGTKRILRLMPKKTSTKKQGADTSAKRKVRELSESELNQVSGGVSSATSVLADAKHPFADAKRFNKAVVGE